MIDPFTAWLRMAEAGSVMQATWLRGLDTLQASKTVVDARVGKIQDAIARPEKADHVELARMTSEKMEAFASSAGAVMRDATTMQNAWARQWQRAGAMMLSGKVPTAAELTMLTTQSMDYALGAITAGAELNKNALAPVHRTVKGNACRLKTGSRRSAKSRSTNKR